MTQRVIPNTQRWSNWTHSGCAASRGYLCTDDAPIDQDDGNYIYTTGSVTAGFALTNPTDPATHWGHVVHVRGRRWLDPGDLGTVSLKVQLRQATTLIEDLGTQTFPAGGYATYTYTVSESGAANITNYNELEVWIESTIAIISGSPEIRVEAIDFECPDVGAMQAGAIAGAATVAEAELLGAGELDATTSPAVQGQATVTGTLVGAGDLDPTTSPAVQGQATTVGTISANGALEIDVPVVGQATVAGAELLGAGRLIGTSPGQATVAEAELLGAGALTGSAYGRAYTYGDWAPPPNPLAITTAAGSFEAHPLWTRVMLPYGRIIHLVVENNTDVRIAGTFTTPDAPEFYLEPGERQQWNLVESPVEGGVYARGYAAGPSTGDLVVEALFR